MTEEVKKSKTKRGRPRIQINFDLVESLASIHCTVDEIASIIGCDRRTLERNKDFCRIYKKGIDNGKMSLRRKQWEAVNGGSIPMMIWLGKQYLGQRDKTDVEASVYQARPLSDFYANADAKRKARSATTKPLSS